MGRVYYANVKGLISDRLIHVIKIPEGTVVLAMRPPEVGERGYSIGLDFTVVDAVKEILNDWNPSDDGPGWEYTESSRSLVRAGGRGVERRPDAGRLQTGPEQLFDVTILAAFEHPRPMVNRQPAGERVFDLVRGWEHRRDQLKAKGEHVDEIEDCIAMAGACVDTVLDASCTPEALIEQEFGPARPTCAECGQFTDEEDDAECGACANCRMPMCIHEMPDEKFAKIADRFDTPCDRWKVKDGKLDAEATHAMHTAATKGEV